MFEPPAAFRISFVCALVLIAIVVVGVLLPSVQPCGGLPANYQPIVAFELSRSVGDLHLLFGAAPGPCRSAMAARMDLTNWVDSFAFIPAYGLFLAFFMFGMRARSRRLFEAAIVVTIVACFADYVENTCLFHLSGAPDRASVWLSLLPWATGVKWIGLGVVAALAGLGLAAKGGANYAALVLCLIGLVVVILANIDPHRFGPYASGGVTLGWLVFLLYDALNTFRARPAATSSN